MTYDPYQAYQTPGGFNAIGNPFQTPFNPMQNPAINSVAGWNPLTAYQPQPAYFQSPPILAGLQQVGFQPGVSPHSHLHLQQLAAQLAQQIVAQQLAAQQIAAQQNPYGQQSPYGQQPFGLQPSLFNQQGFQQGLQQGPMMHPQAGQFGVGGQGISPFGQQPGSPFSQVGAPLAPQSWVGQAGQVGFGLNNPILLAQLTARALQAQGMQGMTPGAGYQAPGAGYQG
jgi:hypothetical protein